MKENPLAVFAPPNSKSEIRDVLEPISIISVLTVVHPLHHGNSRGARTFGTGLHGLVWGLRQ